MLPTGGRRGKEEEGWLDWIEAGSLGKNNSCGGQSFLQLDQQIHRSQHRRGHRWKASDFPSQAQQRRVEVSLGLQWDHCDNSFWQGQPEMYDKGVLWNMLAGKYGGKQSNAEDGMQKYSMWGEVGVGAAWDDWGGRSAQDKPPCFDQQRQKPRYIEDILFGSSAEGPGQNRPRSLHQLQVR